VIVVVADLRKPYHGISSLSASASFPFIIFRQKSHFFFVSLQFDFGGALCL